MTVEEEISQYIINWDGKTWPYSPECLWWRLEEDLLRSRLCDKNNKVKKEEFKE